MTGQQWYRFECQRCGKPFRSTNIRSICQACGVAEEKHGLPPVGEVSGC